MQEQPNIAAQTADFEFAALQEARNYRAALFQEFDEFLSGDVIEVGAGVGQLTDCLRQSPRVKRTIAIEPEPAYCARHRAQFPGHELIQGTVADLPADTRCDAVLSVNVSAIFAVTPLPNCAQNCCRPVSPSNACITSILPATSPGG